jgi:hypothetical protein
MAEILQDHIRLHMMSPDQGMESPEELGEDDRTGAGLSKLTKARHATDLRVVLRVLSSLRPGSIDRDYRSGKKKDGPEPPKPSLENPPG